MKMQGGLQYEPLEHMVDTRVIDLLPGAFDSPLCCTIRNVTLDSAQYEALSYVWGDVPVQATISCNSHDLNIPPSLNIALRYLRYTDRPRTLWADSICINQADKVEKEYHVANMGDIYAKAERVLMWQGETDENTKGALAALGEMLDIFVADPESEEFKRVLADGELAGQLNLTDPSCQTLRDSKLPDYIKVAHLLRRPYFQRAWTLQEGIVAKEGILVLGRETLPSSAIQNAMLAINHDRLRRWKIYVALLTILPKVIDPALAMASSQNFSSMLLMQEGSRVEIMPEWDDTSHLMMLLKLTSSRRCTDPRDSVYALLYLADDVDLKTNTLLAPSYSIDVDEVYHRVARFLIVERKCYNWLAYARGRFEGIPEPALWGLKAEPEPWRVAAKNPSWTPLRLNELTVLTMHYRGICSNYWQLGGSEKAKRFTSGRGAPQDAVLSDDFRTLTVTGRTVDVVALPARDPDPLPFDWPANGAGQLRRIAGDIYPLDINVGMMVVLWLLNSLRGSIGDSWKSAEKPPWELCILLSRCMIVSERQSTESRAKIIQEMYGRFTRSVLRKQIEREEVSKGMEEESKLIEELLMGAAMFKVRITSQGRWAMLPLGSKAGDKVVVVHGVDVPLVLREVDEGKFKVVGDCAVHGLMDGEAIQSEYAIERISLV